MDEAYANRLEADAEGFRELSAALTKLAEGVAPLVRMAKGAGTSDPLRKSITALDAQLRDLAGRLDKLSNQPLPLPLMTMLKKDKAT